MKKILLTLFICIFAFSINVSAFSPVLKYSNAGTLSNWTEESYYSSPVSEDIDGDGNKEIIFSNYSITVLNGYDGSVKFKVNSGYDISTPFSEFGKSVGHTWCDPVVKDIDGDGLKEIITVHGNGLISVLGNNGYFKYGWPKTPVNSSARSLKADDINNDGKAEIIVGYGVDNPTSVYVYDCYGNILYGWPQLSSSNQGKTGWSYGVFMNGISTADLDGDGYKEIIVPTDMSFISIYRYDGTPYPANKDVYGNRNWGNIALYEDYNSEIRGDNGGWGYTVTGGESREELYKAEFGHGITSVCDVDGNGTQEIIATGIMCNRKYAPVYPPSEYMTVCILNSDRTRYTNTSIDSDWSVLPTDLGKPLIQNTKSLPSGVCQTPVAEDIDGDGLKEIIFNSYNGKVHCFSLNKKQPYAWPFSLTKRTSPKYEYATPVKCYDIDNDGKMEIIFASFYDENQSFEKIVQGSLYILYYEGKLISKTSLPPSKEAYNKNNGAMSAPTLSDIDGDGRVEIIINTINGAICVYDI